MAETPSSMIPIGTQMPAFSLPDAAGNQYVPSDDKKGYLIIFICNHCPFVIHIANTLCGISVRCNAYEIDLVCINSNDVIAYPSDSPVNMLQPAAEYRWNFPYLIDETQEVAKAFHATCTPDIFLFDENQQLFYRGQCDDSRPPNGVSDGSDLFAALEQLHTGKIPPKNQKPAIGCNIKWKS